MYTNGCNNSILGSNGTNDNLLNSNNLNNVKLLQQNGHSSSDNSAKISPHQLDTIRVIGQHLYELGFRKTVEQLIQEVGSGLEHPLSLQLRAAILGGSWDKAMNIFNDLSSLVTNENGKKEMKYLILEQKYLELLEKGDQMRALLCLQSEITPLQHCASRLHVLPSYLMINTAEELRKQAGWSGSEGGSRQLLINKIQAFLPSTVMLPPNRLEILLKQAVSYQTEKCVFHNHHSRVTANGTSSTANQSDASPYHVTNVSLLEDHVCSKDSFPAETKQILEHQDEVLDCTWSHSGLHLATGANDGSLYIWKYNPQRYQLVEDKLISVQYAVGQIAWSPDDSMIAVCGVEKCPEVVVWNVTGTEAEVKCRISQSSEDLLTCCVWSHDSRYIYTGGQHGQFYRYEMNGAYTNWEGVRLQAVLSLRNNKGVLAADSHKRVRSYRFDDNTDETICDLEYQIMNMAATKDEKYLLLTLAKQGLLLVELETGTTVEKYYGCVQSDYQINSCFGGANDEFIVCGSEDNLVYVYRRDCSTPILKLAGHSRIVSCVSWNPVYHDCFVSGSDDRTVRLWAPSISKDVPETQQHSSVSV